MEYKTIDLCAGIGGIRRGFEMTKKFKNVLSAEIDDILPFRFTKIWKGVPLFILIFR